MVNPRLTFVMRLWNSFVAVGGGFWWRQ